ncbi:MAG: Hsp20/alpha crystallin family protein [Acidobacteriia bacterium]|nr:Hsp20/alpha crystallin family protein [Terriglobia bacterium]
MPHRSDFIKDLALLQQRFSSLLEGLPLFDADLAPPHAAGLWIPVVDCYETEDKYVVMAELPGVKREAIDIQARGQKLILSGQKKLSSELQKETCHRMECTTGRFQRSLEFPTEVDLSKVDASLKDGVLRIVLPKREPSSRRISIETSE